MNVKELFENEELMESIVEDIEDIPEDSEVTYEVWALGYDTDDDCTEDEVLVMEFTDPEAAVAYAKNLTLDTITEVGFGKPDPNTAYFSIEVETVVEDTEDEDGGTMNIGTVFSRDLWIDGEYGSEDDVDSIVKLKTSEYELIENGIKVSCKLLRNFNKNDIISVCFIDEPGSCWCDFKIISKVIYADGDYYHCDVAF